eukprot:3784813-Rhodomonas_salina.3
MGGGRRRRYRRYSETERTMRGGRRRRRRLCPMRFAMSSADIGLAMQCAVLIWAWLSSVRLCCYQAQEEEAAEEALQRFLEEQAGTTCLGPRYAMSGTETACGASLATYALCDVRYWHVAYYASAMRCPVPT